MPTEPARYDNLKHPDYINNMFSGKPPAADIWGVKSPEKLIHTGSSMFVSPSNSYSSNNSSNQSRGIMFDGREPR